MTSVEETCPPWTIDTEVGESESVKSREEELTWTAKSILCLTSPFVPVIRKVNVPTEAVELAITVKVAAVVRLSGGDTIVAKVNVTPEGADPIHATDNPIGELKPLIEVTVSVVAPLVP